MMKSVSTDAVIFYIYMHYYRPKNKHPKELNLIAAQIDICICKNCISMQVLFYKKLKESLESNFSKKIKKLEKNCNVSDSLLNTKCF